jgi:hypothetical protein
LLKKSSLFACLAIFTVAMAAQTTKTYSNVDELSGWTACSACALGGANAHFIFKTKVASPSMDGASIRESINGGTPFSHVLSFKNLGSTSTSTHHFIQDAYLYLDKPANANGFSIAGHQTIGGKHYRFSTQCSFNKGLWSVWDTKNGKWAATSLACTRPAANTWTHIVVETERTTDNREHLVSITINGAKHIINKYVYPEGGSGSNIGMHLEVDGNRTESAYSGYWDKVKFTTW